MSHPMECVYLDVCALSRPFDDQSQLMLPTWPLLRPQKLTLSPATIASFGSAGAFNQAFGLAL